MKKMKKIVSLLLAMVMVLAMTVGVSAATVTVPSDGILKGHTFTAYQIFSGTESDGILTEVQWGSGVNSDTFLAALKADTTYGSLFTDCTDAAAVAKVLSDNNTNTALANAVAKLAYANKTGTGTALTAGENTLDYGYYLVVDTTADVGKGGAYNTSILQVVSNINITVKTDVPTVKKKVWEDDKFTDDDGYGTGYNDVADHDMGTAVPFELIGSVPDMSRYDTYKYIFHDTLSNGLTAPARNNVKVYLSSDEKHDSNDTDITSSFGVTVSGQSITVSCTDLKEITDIAKDKYIIVAYTAVLNQSAAVGLPGNPNTVYLEYSNKPDQSGSGDTGNTGKTPEDTVIVFTYELDTTKVDGQDNNTKLKGAEFVLYKKVNDEKKYAIVNEQNKVTGWGSATINGSVESYPEGSKLTSGADGLFKVIGLDDGVYYLKETKAPNNYNLLTDDIELTIKANTSNGQNWNAPFTPSEALKETTTDAGDGLKITMDGTTANGDISTGIVNATVKNNKGATLPETGGMGTTIFYVVGVILVLGAVVLLITKKRMSANK